MAILTVKRGGKDGKFGTIEAALSAASEGDTIELSPGRYEEIITIAIPSITIRAVERHKATICSRKGENSLSVITVEADGVTISGIDIRGASGTKKNSQDTIPAVLILAKDVAVTNCRVSGKWSIGIKTYEMNTKVTSCDVDVGNTAILAMEQSSSIWIDNCKLKSTNDTGIWLSKSVITETSVHNCGHTGIWLDSSTAILRNVNVSGSKSNGIVFDWPESTPLPRAEYTFLSHTGHCLENVTVEKCKENGICVFPGVRVVCTGCTFSNNGDAGAFFEGPEDKDKMKEEKRRKRVKNCDGSIIDESIIHNNAGFGVESEELGLVKLTGHTELVLNKKGGMNKHVVSPEKRARSTISPVKPSKTDGGDDDRVQIVRVKAPKSKPSSNAAQPRKIKNQPTDPVSKVTQKSGVTLPKNWPPGLYFIGDTNVSSFPGPDKLHEFYLTHRVEVNKKVEIDVSPENRGLGLFAARTLRKGQVVGYYSGHLRKQQVKHDSEYVANWRPIGVQVDGEWEIDAEWGGNEMRFANYPSEGEAPNMKANCIIRNNLQVIAFKATVDIKKGTELLWDYGSDYLEED